MKLAYYIKDGRLATDARVADLLAQLSAEGFELVQAGAPGDIPEGTAMLLSLGGDGTFLSAAALAYGLSLPVLGVNFGRLGFLSENKPSDVAQALAKGDYSIRRCGMLGASCSGLPGGELLALNDICVLRKGAPMLGIDVEIDSRPLPTYWADGLLVATSSGSTAYNLSVGGPICLPDAKVLILSPIASHNLNVRPLVLPDTASIRISFCSRDERLGLAADNREYIVGTDSSVTVHAVPDALRHVVLGGSNFIEALRDRLLWGRDVRNVNQ